MPEMRIRPRHCETPVPVRRPRARRVTTTVGALAAAALLAACGSSGGSSNGGSSGGGSSSASSSASSSSGKGTVMVGKVNGYGSVLVTAADQPILEFPQVTGSV